MNSLPGCIFRPVLFSPRQTHQVRTEEKRPFDEKCASLCYRLLSATKLIYNRQMPGGGRKTHEFPKGMPLPLLVVEIAFAVGIFILIVWFMKAGFHSWREGALLGVV